eukprot:scaffold78237_cov30-Tisochrysis_lutea.AAC.1
MLHVHPDCLVHRVTVGNVVDGRLSTLLSCSCPRWRRPCRCAAGGHPDENQGKGTTQCELASNRFMPSLDRRIEFIIVCSAEGPCLASATGPLPRDGGVHGWCMARPVYVARDASQQDAPQDYDSKRGPYLTTELGTRNSTYEGG